MVENKKDKMKNLKNIINIVMSGGGDGVGFGDILLKLGTEDLALTGDDFKKWKEHHGEDFTWDRASKIVGLTVRRCTDFANFGDKEIPERVTKIIILAECVHAYIGSIK